MEKAVDLSRLFSGEHWFDPNPGPPTQGYALLAFLFAAVLGASLYLYFKKGKLFGEHRLLLNLASQASIVGIVLGGVGLVLVISRFLTVPYLSARGLVYLTLIALVGVVVYYAYYLLRVLPSKLVRYEAETLRRKYLPKPVSPVARPAKKKGKRRR